jgi:hypothetical protein
MDDWKIAIVPIVSVGWRIDALAQLVDSANMLVSQMATLIVLDVRESTSKLVMTTPSASWISPR